MSNVLPTISSYGEYSSDNYGAHTLRVEMPGVTVWFSYKTAVAFKTYGEDGRFVVRENEWGPTTGKHLNWVDGGKRENRVSGAEFERLWSELVVQRGEGVAA